MPQTRNCTTHATYTSTAGSHPKRVSPLEHLHVCEDCGYDEEYAHEDDVVGVDLLGGGRERTAVPPVGLSALARLVVAVRPSALLPVYRPESKIFFGRLLFE